MLDNMTMNAAPYGGLYEKQLAFSHVCMHENFTWDIMKRAEMKPVELVYSYY